MSRAKKGEKLGNGWVVGEWIIIRSAPSFGRDFFFVSKVVGPSNTYAKGIRVKHKFVHDPSGIDKPGSMNPNQWPLHNEDIIFERMEAKVDDAIPEEG